MKRAPNVRLRLRLRLALALVLMLAMVARIRNQALLFPFLLRLSTPLQRLAP